MILPEPTAPITGPDPACPFAQEVLRPGDYDDLEWATRANAWAGFVRSLLRKPWKVRGSALGDDEQTATQKVAQVADAMLVEFDKRFFNEE